MSKLGSLGRFLLKIDKVFLVIPNEALGPLAPFAPELKAAIVEANSLPGATNADKLTHVTNIVVDAAQEAKNAGKDIDPEAVRTEASTVISAVVQAAKLVNPDPPK